MASDDEEGSGTTGSGSSRGGAAGAHPLSPQCVRALYDVIDLAPVDRELPSARPSPRGSTLWLNPILDAATSANDFDLRELRRQPMSIYRRRQSRMTCTACGRCLNLFFQQAIGLQTRALPEHNPALKYQVLMVLDEFPALGRIPIMAEASGYLPGYNVRVLLIMQTPAQLREIYGEDGSRDDVEEPRRHASYFQPKDMADARGDLRRARLHDREGEDPLEAGLGALEWQDGPRSAR